jgi:hypothetical protein
VDRDAAARFAFGRRVILDGLEQHPSRRANAATDG